MNSLRILGAVAALALTLPMTTPSFAQQGRGGHGGGGGGHFSMGGGSSMGGGGAAFRGGGANFAGARPAGVGPQIGGGRSFAAAGNWRGGGGNWNGGHWHGGWHRSGGFWPGVAAGAAVGALGSYAYYGAPYYDDPSYYDDGYYDQGPSVAVVPDDGGDSSAYCAQQYRSYDPASGTYLGYDGLRHPCP